MKNLLNNFIKPVLIGVLIGFIALLLLTSCEADPCEIPTTEAISYDTQDNVIKLGGCWVTSMNMNVSPFVKYNWIGFDQSTAPNTIKITSDKRITQVLIPAFYLPHTITYVSPYEVIFYSEYYNYYRDNNDVFYFTVSHYN